MAAANRLTRAQTIWTIARHEYLTNLRRPGFIFFTLLIPAQTMASDQGAARTSVLPMGSLFEGALFLLFEIMVLKLQALTKATPEAMRARHTNME